MYPDWAKWEAKNYLGATYCYEFIPIPNEDGYWSPADMENERYQLISKGDGHICEDWHKSLKRCR